MEEEEAARAARAAQGGEAAADEDVEPLVLPDGHKLVTLQAAHGKTAIMQRRCMTCPVASSDNRRPRTTTCCSCNIERAMCRDCFSLHIQG
jgi:hypothetical protein